MKKINPIILLSCLSLALPIFAKDQVKPHKTWRDDPSRNPEKLKKDEDKKDPPKEPKKPNAEQAKSTEKPALKAEVSDTLASRHPFLAIASLIALNSWYGSRLEGAAETANLKATADFSLGLIGPSALKVMKVESGAAGAALLVLSLVSKRESQFSYIAPVAPVAAAAAVGAAVAPAAAAPVAAAGYITQTSYLDPVLYSAALSLFSTDLRNQTKPWIEEVSNQTVLAEYTNATQYLVPAAAGLVPFLVHAAITKGQFDGLLGSLTKGAGVKVVYVLCDGLEAANKVLGLKLIGDQWFLESISQVSTSAELGLLSYGLSALPAGGVAATLASLSGEVAGYELASSAFSAIDQGAPKYAPYVNPLLGASLVGLVSYQYLHGRLSGKGAIAKAAALGAATAGFIQVFLGVLSLPGWLEEIPSRLWVKNFTVPTPWGAWVHDEF